MSFQFPEVGQLVLNPLGTNAPSGEETLLQCLQIFKSREKTTLLESYKKKKHLQKCLLENGTVTIQFP